VKGCCHRNDAVIAIPRYVKGIKLRRLKESYEYIYRYYKDYIVYEEFLCRPSPMIFLDDIIRVIRPSKEPCRNVSKDLYEKARELIRLLDEEGLNSFLTGSLLYCAADDSSDIDIVIYTHDHEKNYRDVMEKLINRNIFNRLDDNDITKIISKVGEGLEHYSHKMILRRSVHELKYKNTIVSIRFVDCSADVKKILCNKLRVCENYHGVLKIIDDEKGFTTPSIYLAEDMSSKEVYYVYSHRMRFADLRSGDRIFYKGFVEKTCEGFNRINLDIGDVRIIMNI
jgi:predicted nucleotidyltransferase